ncbi:MAG: hypothetical protein IJJ69_08965 [Oscillospiraceae bacterium]|nr:hypothetical protein [Oscillospiraceae bacterium]
MKILNLHGYHASAENSACYALKACGYEVISPQIDYDNEFPRDLIAKLTELYQSAHCEAVVGSSMGGFFAETVSHLIKNCPAVLINPCITPHIFFAKAGVTDKRFLSEYLFYTHNFESAFINPYEMTHAIIGLKDDTLDTHDYIIAMLGKENCELVPDGGHPGSTLPLEYIFRMHEKWFTEKPDCKLNDDIFNIDELRNNSKSC